MIVPPKPSNELTRQRVLESYDVLDSHAEAAYDDLTLLASKVCDVPIAVISLIDKERQWFKAKVGLDAPETPRDVSFCGHAILTPDIMEVPDALNDARFFDNPLVLGEPQIRFYAGAPLIVPTGEVLGTICVIDRKPRKLNETQTIALRTLARNVVTQLELRNHIGRLVQRENALNEMSENSKKVLRARTDFFARMSHEIRTPLNGVIGMIESVLNTQINSQQLESLIIAKQSGESLLRIINDILDMSVIESQQISIEKIDFNLSQTVQRTLQLFSRMVTAKGLTLSGENILQDLWIKTDPTRFTQILNNILGNAIKFTERGSIDISLSKVGGPEAPVIQLAITDTGIGMTEEVRARIFTPYSQGGDETIHRRFGGTGLGLSISKELTQLLGGSLTCDSEYGKGSRFVIQLPAMPVSSKLADPAHHGWQAPERWKNFSDVQILIADDDPINRRVFRAIFEKLGCKFLIVTNGEEALSAMRDSDFDLILMDRHMPGTDGLEATRRIRAQQILTGRRVPILATSATSDKSDHRLFWEAGMDGMVSKPIRFKELCEKIESCLGPRLLDSRTSWRKSG